MAIRIIEFATGFQTDELPGTTVPASTIVVTPAGDLGSTNVQAALVELQGDIDVSEAAHAAHLANLSNPHSVTKVQVGLGNVDNTSDATKNAAVATLTNKTISGASNTLTVRAASDITGQLPIANGGTGQATKAAAFDALSPNTTKGDITARTLTTNDRLAVGADGTVLTASSAAATGLAWTAPLVNPMTAAGDIIYGGVAGAATRLAPNITTTRRFLTGTGTGAVGQAPVWTDIAGTVPGVTTNTVIATGNIGELVSNSEAVLRSQASPTASTNYSVGTGLGISLTPGHWRITVQMTLNAQAVPSGKGSMYGIIWDQTNSLVIDKAIGGVAENLRDTNQSVTASIVVRISNTTEYRAMYGIDSYSGLSTAGATIYVRGELATTRIFATRIG